MDKHCVSLEIAKQLKEAIVSLKEEIDILKWIMSGMGATQKTQEKLKETFKEDYERAEKRIKALSFAISILERIEVGKIEPILTEWRDKHAIQYTANVAQSIITYLTQGEKDGGAAGDSSINNPAHAG